MRTFERIVGIAASIALSSSSAWAGTSSLSITYAPVVAEVPISPWALIALAIGLGALAHFVLRNRDTVNRTVIGIAAAFCASLAFLAPKAGVATSLGVVLPTAGGGQATAPLGTSSVTNTSGVALRIVSINETPTRIKSGGTCAVNVVLAPSAWCSITVSAIDVP